ncbi:MAG: 50S ribosomal protein L25 [Myxococcales bacterium]|nr:50S ribosomal protein L25 [Myxococcales bacterium]MCB9644342.1 50S ribosomal protein L25 [Myxococcales bacterium]
MEQVILSVTHRTETGKSAARNIRKQGQIPALAYAGGNAPIHFSVDPVELLKQLRNKGKNTLLTLQSEHGPLHEQTVMLREMQRNALNRSPIHADFAIVDQNKPVQATIKVTFTGKPAGAALGGVVEILHTKLTVECLPALIPTDSTVDISGLGLASKFTVADLGFAEGVSVVGGNDLALVTVSEG